MTAMATHHGRLDAFRKSWICVDCGGSNAVAARECEGCGQSRGSSAPRVAQSFALNNQGNGSVVNNVLVVGGDVDARREVYHVAHQEPESTPTPRYAHQAPAPYYPPAPAPYQLTSGSSKLAKGAEVAKWVSAFVIVPIAFFFIWFIYAGVQQILRVVPL